MSLPYFYDSKPDVQRPCIGFFSVWLMDGSLQFFPNAARCDSHNGGHALIPFFKHLGILINFALLNHAESTGQQRDPCWKPKAQISPNSPLGIFPRQERGKQKH
jgi:hypothetical protein